MGARHQRRGLRLNPIEPLALKVKGHTVHLKRGARVLKFSLAVGEGALGVLERPFLEGELSLSRCEIALKLAELITEALEGLLLWREPSLTLAERLLCSLKLLLTRLELGVALLKGALHLVEGGGALLVSAIAELKLLLHLVLSALKRGALLIKGAS